MGVVHYWNVCFGPQGTPVNPCRVEPFDLVYKSVAHGKESAIDAPPSTPKGSWSGMTKLDLHDDATCTISSDSIAPPTLSCGQTLQIDFARDPKYDDPVMECDDGFMYHRLLYVEYTV